jgi:Tfp pilus assembly protein PilN
VSAQNKNKINLLQKRGFEATTVGRVVGWLLSTFRIILIFTEIIVMAAFFSRFYLDAKNTDLSEEIQQKQAVIESFSNIEHEFRSAQNKLKFYSDVSIVVKQNSKVLDNIRVSLPENSDELSLTNINLHEDRATLDGVSLSEKSIQQFIANLMSTSNVEKASLNKVTGKKNDAYLDFSLTMNLVPDSSLNKE